jgi:hypothetical protein
MSKQKPRTRAVGTIPLRHELEHEVPMIIHDPEADMTALGRVVKHLLEKPASFWGLVLGGTAAVLVALGIWSAMSGGRVAGSEAWAKLNQSRDPGDLAAIAKEYPGSPAAQWALLQAGATYYNRGLDDLPNNRDVALPTLKKALDAYEEVIKSAAKDSPQARIALMGKGRTLEARNELPQAIETYEVIVKTWPDTPEAAEAKGYAAALQKPEAAAFYKELYSYAPSKLGLPSAPPDAMKSLLDLAPGASSPLGGSFPQLPGMDLKPGETVKLPGAPGRSETPFALPDAVMTPTTESTPATPKPVAPAEAKPAPAPAKPAETKPAPAPAKPADAKPAPAPAKPAETKPAPAPAKPADAKPAAVPAKP